MEVTQGDICWHFYFIVLISLTFMARGDRNFISDLSFMVQTFGLHVVNDNSQFLWYGVYAETLQMREV